MSNRDDAYLQHMLDAISNIKTFTENVDANEFKNNELVQSAVIRQIEIIGEATKKVSDKTKAHYPDVPWRDIAGMRDKLIHGYFGVDIDAVWDTIQRDIPTLQQYVEKILDKKRNN